MKCIGPLNTSTFVTKTNGEYVLSQHLRGRTEQKIFITEEMFLELIEYYESRRDES